MNPKASNQPLRSGVAEYFCRQVRAFLPDQELLKAVVGPFGSARLLNCAVEQLGTIRQRAAEAPALVPLLGSTLARGGSVPPDFGRIQTELLASGLSRAAWRWLAKRDVSTVSRLLGYGTPSTGLHWANVLAEAQWTDSDPPLDEEGAPCGFDPFTPQISALALPTFRPLREDLLRLLRLSIEQWRGLLSPYALDSFLNADAPAIVRMCAQRMLSEGERLPPGVTWGALVRTYEEMVVRAARQAREEAQGSMAAEGASPPPAHHLATLRHVEVDNVKARLLDTPDSLAEEGAQMRHCAADYWQQCGTGYTRIYSLRSATGERATLELGYVEGQWLVVQLSGPGNAAPSGVFEKVARRLAMTHVMAIHR